MPWDTGLFVCSELLSCRFASKHDWQKLNWLGMLPGSEQDSDADATSSMKAYWCTIQKLKEDCSSQKTC